MASRLLFLELVLLAAPASAQSTRFNIPVPGVAYRNGCTSNCPLLLSFHGVGDNGNVMAAGSNIHNLFTGIVAYPSETTSGGSFPTASNQDHWAANLQVVNTLISLPEVDRTNVYMLGFSNGGFFCYALACYMGNQLRAIVSAAGLKEVQPSCPQNTNTLAIHNANDNFNRPIDVGGGQGKGAGQLGAPVSLRNDWLDPATYPTRTTNGPTGVTSGAFTLYSARQSNSQRTIRFEYWSWNGAASHTYPVYSGAPSGAPGARGMEAYVVSYFGSLTNVPPSRGPPRPPPPPSPLPVASPPPTSTSPPPPAPSWCPQYCGTPPPRESYCDQYGCPVLGVSPPPPPPSPPPSPPLPLPLPSASPAFSPVASPVPSPSQCPAMSTLESTCTPNSQQLQQRCACQYVWERSECSGPTSVQLHCIA